MSASITIEVRHVYGVPTIYPACPTASLLARLAGTKTITSDALRTIRELGYSVQVKAPDTSALLG